MVVRGGTSLLMSVDGEAKVTVHIPVNDCNSHFDYLQLNLMQKQWECMLVKIAPHEFYTDPRWHIPPDVRRRGSKSDRSHPCQRLQLSL
ncbi:hypothetical protein T12_7952 [Trichinella patagoniensis]|uniref:Uncharacterized protein n=1 Tax=Trichinella patagoniensis TaxID=990121 RepID=A0A0V0ZLK7_9BILA|nr:hypothetical protein T12_7952 [Trichinella patagoniensis]